jgi:glycosyltransferase involved in cell wall biosynthesis
MNDDLIKYELFSGTTTDQDIQTIDNSLARVPIGKGGLRWKISQNIWLNHKKLLIQPQMIKEAILGQYDVIIFLGSPYFISTWLALGFSRLFGKRTLLWTHGIIRDNYKDWFKLLFYRLADGLLLYGNGAKKRLIEYGFNPEKMFVIYNSLNYDLQLKFRKTISKDAVLRKKSKLFKYPKYPVLIFIGRLTPIKEIDKLILACKKMHEKVIPVNLLIIGDGSERDKLVALVRKNNLSDFVTFYGESYSEEELSLLIALSDLCVSPGNVGLSAIHSLTYGTPVITHNNPKYQMPEYEAITEGVTGSLYQYGSLDSLIESIIKWIIDKKDFREEVRLACYDIIDRFYNPHFQKVAIREAIFCTTSKKKND